MQAQHLGAIERAAGNSNRNCHPRISTNHFGGGSSHLTVNLVFLFYKFAFVVEWIGCKWPMFLFGTNSAFAREIR